MAMPAVVLILAACLSAAQLGVRALAIHDAAAVIARVEARGSPGGSAEAMARAGPGATVQFERRGTLTCARVSTRARVVGIPLGNLDLTSLSCAPTARP